MCEIRCRVCPFCRSKDQNTTVFQCPEYWVEYRNAFVANAPECEYPDPLDCPNTEGTSKEFTLGACPRFHMGCPSRTIWHQREALKNQRAHAEFMRQRAFDIAEDRRQAKFAHQHFQKRTVFPKLEAPAGHFLHMVCKDALDRRTKKEEIQDLREQAMQDALEAVSAMRPFVQYLRSFKPKKKKNVRFMLPGAPEGVTCAPTKQNSGEESAIIPEADTAVPKHGKESDMAHDGRVKTGNPNSDDTKTTNKPEISEAETTKKPVPGGYPMKRQKARRPQQQSLPARHTPSVGPVFIKKKAPPPTTTDDYYTKSPTEEELRPLYQTDFTLLPGAPDIKVYAPRMPLPDIRRQPRGALPLDINDILDKFRAETSQRDMELQSSVESTSPWSSGDEKNGSDGKDTPESSQPSSHQGDATAAAPERLSLIRPPPGFENAGDRYVKDAASENPFLIHPAPHLLTSGLVNENETGNGQWEYTTHSPPPVSTGCTSEDKKVSDSEAADNPATATGKGSPPAPETQMPCTKMPCTKGLISEDLRKLMKQAINGEGSTSGAVESVSPSEFIIPPGAPAQPAVT